MRKIHPNSRIEIWSADYINNDTDRCLKRDKSVDIVQIEYASGDDYIVEIVEKAEKEKTPDIGELARQVVEEGKKEGFVI